MAIKANEPIKIRIGKQTKQCWCTGCGKSSRDEQKEFYDMLIGDQLVHLCFECLDMMFQKTLKAQVAYQGKLKTPKRHTKR